MKRDIKRDRETCEIFTTTDEEWHIEPRPMYYVNEAGEPVLGEDGKPLESPHSYLAVVDEDRKEITGFDDSEEGYALARAFIESRTMTPYYIDRCEELEGVIVKKDEALQAMLDAHPLGMLIWNIGKCRICGASTASGMIQCCVDCADKAARNALSITPASVAKEVEDARVGSAVREWLDAQGWVDRVVFADTGGLHVMLNELREVITKAREATPHA